MWPYYCGTITEDWLDAHGTQADRSAEASRFYDNCLVYYYFHNKKGPDGVDLVERILSTGQIASLAKCWDPSAILLSLSGPDPHYGDGTYVTFHPALHVAHREIQRHHGLNTSCCRWRALLSVNNARRFYRVLQTGGVGIAPPNTCPQPGQLLFLGPPDVTIVSIHTLDSFGQWRRWSP
jgi:hypothetical protein